MPESSNPLDRRGFLKAAAVATGLTIMSGSARSTQANTKIKLGIIGCGGRGQFIGDLVQENGSAQITALHDYFKDRVDGLGERYGVPPSGRFTGLQGYKQLIASGVDAVAVLSPPYFHPEQTVAALEAGKHVYLAKPIAVDVPGCLAIVEAASKVKGRLSVLVDFQTRVDEFYQGVVQRVHDGLIGEPVCGQAYYHDGRLGIHAEPGSEEARLRNWVFDKALSGDIIVEQNIHMLDVANWFLRGHPVKAAGTGGRKARTDVGDCWDHFVVTYWYPNDVIIDFSSTQFLYGFSDLCTRIYGSSGTADTHYGGQVIVRAKRGGWRGGETRQIYRNGAVTNIKAFCESIFSGEHVDNVEESANSTLTAVLGRIAAYEGRPVTWEEMIREKQRLDARLRLE